MFRDLALLSSAAFRLVRALAWRQKQASYRLTGSAGNRTPLFQCLAHSVEWEDARWRRLDDLHRLCNRCDYGDIIDVSEEQVETTLANAQATLTKRISGVSEGERRDS